LKNIIKQAIIDAFELHCKDKIQRTEILPMSGSYREYIRLIGYNSTAIGVYNADKKENNAFVTFSNHFKNKGLSVPDIYFVNSEDNFYLQEDLGSTALFDVVESVEKGEKSSNDLLAIYKKVIKQLIQFQLQGGEGLDYKACYPRASFDKQSMMWDLNYFKYYFLKLAKIPFDEQLLENDFDKFVDFLLQAPSDYFLYRDFQSKNIMIKNNEPYFIDYQGGRKGALQYDLASLLYDSRPDLSEDIRDELLDFYMDELKKNYSFDREEFKSKYIAYVVIRVMQAMGAFGFRGFYERKDHFLNSIPYAVKHLDFLLKNKSLDVDLPELSKVLLLLSKSEVLKNIE